MMPILLRKKSNNEPTDLNPKLKGLLKVFHRIQHWLLTLLGTLHKEIWSQWKLLFYSEVHSLERKLIEQRSFFAGFDYLSHYSWDVQKRFTAPDLPGFFLIIF